MSRAVNVHSRWNDPHDERNHCFALHFHALGREEILELLDHVRAWVEKGTPLPLEWQADNCPLELGIAVSETGRQMQERIDRMDKGRAV